MSVLQIDRRTFLKIGGTAAGGLLVGCYVRRERGTSSSAVFRPNGYVRIDPDGTVVLWSKNPEMGQGIKTTLTMMIAEELDVEWSSVRVEQAELNRTWYGGQGAGGTSPFHRNYCSLPCRLVCVWTLDVEASRNQNQP